MNWLSGIAIYFLIWWLTLFAVLPWGVRTQEEEGEVIEGTVRSAPAKPQLLKKVIATTVVSGIIFAALMAIHLTGAVSLDDIPLLPKF
ncbi:MAG: DUF1467 family protein [Hyphomicrobiales bacterium]|nr:DUF1467 family protein [Hyphomicrobiales bacterium]